MAHEINLDTLKLVLKKKGITLLKLSEMTGISTPHLSMMFAGKRNMSVEKLNKILIVTDTLLDEIC